MYVCTNKKEKKLGLYAVAVIDVLRFYFPFFREQCEKKDDRRVETRIVDNV